MKITDKMRLDWVIRNIFGYTDAPNGKRHWSFETQWLEEPLIGRSVRSAIDAAIRAAKKPAPKRRGK